MTWNRISCIRNETTMIKIHPKHFALLDGTLDGLKKSLRLAIQLEHSTIPPYLYALYSIKPLQNAAVAELIRSVVREEMLHMSLDCNILNAIGGAPRLDDPDLIPKYPGPLPGGVDHGLTVPLAPLSKSLVLDVFMAIEEPEHPVTADDPELTCAKHETIGDFYAEIKRQIDHLSCGGKNIFVGDPARQLRAGFSQLQTLSITDAESAKAAIDIIVEQGEGSTQSPKDPDRELAHYYKYAEIYYGRKLIKLSNPKPGTPEYGYEGDPIPFYESGIWPSICNPKRSNYPKGSQAAVLNDAFNHTYTRFLHGLQRVFNGQPDYLGPAFTGMQSLRDQAMVLMSLEFAPGKFAGPSFEYTPLPT
jgi:hypothetical protein